MLSVRINGAESGINGGKVLKLTDLIELIKSSIDPDHMITTIKIDGREIEEADWHANLSQNPTSIIEVDTDTPENFVNARLVVASDVVRSCFYEFREARKAFQGGEMLQGNQKLIRAVNTAKAFFEWYATMLQLVAEGKRAKFDINSQVQDISEVCKRICQQQLYQSWWALGETIEKELEPKLDKLEDFCRGFSQQI